MALYYTNSRDTVYCALNYRDLWIAIGKLTRTNNSFIYDDLSDDDKNNLKFVFNTINEQSAFSNIEEIESESRILRVKTNNKMYKFKWNYEHVHYTKYYNDNELML